MKAKESSFVYHPIFQYFLAPLVVALISILVTRYFTQKDAVQKLSNGTGIVNEGDTIEDAVNSINDNKAESDQQIDYLKEQLKEKEQEIDDLNRQIIDLEANTNYSNAIDRAKEYAANEDYGVAIDTLKGVKSPTNEVTSLINIYEEKAASQLWSKVRTKINEGDYDGASQLINEYKYNLPEGYDLEQLKKEIADTKPKPISDLVEVDSKNWSVNEGKPIDHFNNEHYSAYTSTIVNSNEYLSSDNAHYVEYRSYKDYNKLTGIISPYNEIEGATVRILFDERLVQTYELGKKTDPIPFEFDISDVDYIRFEVDLLWRSGVIISDVLITK